MVSCSTGISWQGEVGYKHGVPLQVDDVELLFATLSSLTNTFGSPNNQIGSYLGLKLETVSRTFSKFAEEGIVEVKQRHIHISDADALKRIVNPQICQ